VAAVAAVQRSEYSCEVTNTGTMDGDEVVFLFHRPKDSPAAVAAHAASSSGGDDNSDASVAPQHWALPKKALIDWKRVAVPAGKTISVSFTVDASMLALRGAEGPAVATFHSGEHLIAFSAPFYTLKTIILPRQARDKHRENSEKSGVSFHEGEHLIEFSRGHGETQRMMIDASCE